jgi:hypothetical protein
MGERLKVYVRNLEAGVTFAYDVSSGTYVRWPSYASIHAGCRCWKVCISRALLLKRIADTLYNWTVSEVVPLHALVRFLRPFSVRHN